MLDPIKNLVYVNTLTGYSSSDLIITLQSGEGAKLPQPSTDGAFNLVWYNHSLYKNPADDPNVEIVRVTGRSGDVLTISRAQESTTATNKNTSGGNYRLILGMTKKMLDDIQTALNNTVNLTGDQEINGEKTFNNGAAFLSGAIFTGQRTPFPTDLGVYVANYYSTAYTVARILSYNGAAYQDLAIGAMVSAGIFGMLLKADGSTFLSRAINEAKGTDIASASSIDLGAATGNLVDVTGTTTITALGTIQAGTRRIVRFTGALTLTHNATSLILPTGANIATAAGDTATFISLGSGNWVCTNYQRKDGTALKKNNTRLVTAASYTTDTGTSLNCDTTDQFEVTAQAGALLFNAPSGTPVGGQKLIIRIKDNGTARALTYNAIFRPMGNALPTTTVVSKTLYMGFIYNATDSKWDLVAVAQEA